MPLFRYEALDRNGNVVAGAMDAPDANEVAARLAQKGYSNPAVVAAPRADAGAKRRTSSRTEPEEAAMGGATARDMAVLFRQMASLLRAGITPHQAAANLAAQTRQPALAHSLRAMAEAARTGGTLSEVMERYPRLYAPHHVGTVRAGESGGFLEIAMDEIAQEAERELAFYKGIWLARMLVVQGVLAIAIAQPLFPTLFPNAQFGTYLVLVLLRNLPIAAALILCGRLFSQWLRSPERRTLRDEWLLRLPVFGDLTRQWSLAAFVRMLKRLYQAGLGPAAAWEGAMHVAPNAVIRDRLIAAGAAVRAGVPLHEAFTNTGLFANETEQLLATGVLSGQVVEMLDRIEDYYQNNVEQATTAARFALWRVAVTAALLLGGVLLIMMVRTYFQAVFDFTKDW